MKSNQGYRIITIILCILGSIFCYQNFINKTSKTVFLIGGIVWSIAAIVNIIRMVIDYKKNKNVSV
jgi:EamA domain-containing membrane protein RarD